MKKILLVTASVALAAGLAGCAQNHAQPMPASHNSYQSGYSSKLGRRHSTATTTRRHAKATTTRSTTATSA